MQNLLTLAIVVAFIAAVQPLQSSAQKLATGPQVLTIYSDIDDTEQPYALYLPPDFDESRAYPLVISLHGAGSNHRLNLKRVFGKTNVGDETDVEASRYFPEWRDQPFIVASPFARGTMGYQGIAEKDVMDVLADVQRRFRIDENRIYLTGLSMGGGGTLWIALTRPDLFAAIAPVCPAPPQGTDALAGNAINLPVHIHQGGADPVVRPEGVRAWVNRLDSLGVDVEYTEYPGVAHDAWDPAYADGKVFDWFAQHVRNPFPERVRYSSIAYDYTRAYWVTLDALTPGALATIDASFDGPNHVVISTTDLDGFTLSLNGHPMFNSGDEVRLDVDGASLSARGETISLRKSNGMWEIGRYEHAANEKNAGAEGPIGEVVAQRHVYVYGTADNPSQQEIAQRRMQAEEAANWSVYRGAFLGRVMVFPRVLADREVRQSDLDEANLILFGTRETNSLIDRFADRLPMHLSDTSQGYGLVYVYPMEGRYVLVASGTPWWASQGGGANFFANQIPAMRLPAGEDYIVFRNSMDSPVAAGRFDRLWQLPAEDAEAIRATGAVTISGN